MPEGKCIQENHKYNIIFAFQFDFLLFCTYYISPVDKRWTVILSMLSILVLFFFSIYFQVIFVSWFSLFFFILLSPHCYRRHFVCFISLAFWLFFIFFICLKLLYVWLCVKIYYIDGPIFMWSSNDRTSTSI